MIRIFFSKKKDSVEQLKVIEQKQEGKPVITTKPETNGYKTVFTINFDVGIAKLPDITDPKTFQASYTIIDPYVKVVISYDDVLHELVYKITEPELDDKSRKLLKLIGSSMEELINISFIAIQDQKTVIEFLEKNVLLLLNELKIEVSKDVFIKIMYYIYRDFVGMNKMEPLLRDYFIEDIECNGVGTPIYIVHRKYKNLRTNIVYKTVPGLMKFVEKVAQKCGKYISYATPLLDGTLPDNSRVNAVYAQDVASRGPALTIRKFTKEPWTPIHLMSFKTVSPEMLAYLWVMVENGSNIMVIGGTGSGKCVVGNTPIYLSDGSSVPIRKIIEQKFRDSKIKFSNEWEYVDGDGTEIKSLDVDNLKIIDTKIDKFWRHKAPDILVKAKTRSGREIITTPEHPFFTFVDGKLVNIRADKLYHGCKIAVPRYIPFEQKKVNLDILNKLKNENDLFVPEQFKLINEVSRKLIKKYKLSCISDVSRKYNIKDKTFRCWLNKNAIPLTIYLKLLEDGGLEVPDKIKLKGITSKIKINLPELKPKLFRFIGLLIGDGHLTNRNVILHNANLSLLNEFLELGKELFRLSGRIHYPKDRTTYVVFNAVPMAKMMNKVFGIPFGKKSNLVSVPKILHKLSNEYVSEFLSGMFDTDGYVGKKEIEFCSTSKKMVDEVSTLLLRFGIISYKVNEDRVMINGINNFKLFSENIKLRKPDKIQRLNEILNRKIKKYISNVDLIPNVNTVVKELREDIEFTQNELANEVGVSRRLIGMWENGVRDPSRMSFGQLADSLDEEIYDDIHKISASDVFWDGIDSVEMIKDHNEEYVYDLTVDYHHNFLAGNIPIIAHNTSLLNTIAFFIPPSARVVSIEDTRELQLNHENWLPSVARQGIGFGKSTQGEVTLFDLLKESFRQRPDQIIVGEIRGAEAFVLFQAAASGHPAMATMHADNVETMVKRLETQPINLSPSLVEILDLVCLMGQVQVGGRPVRRLISVSEIVNVDESTGNAETNLPFFWDPKTDRFYFRESGYALEKLSVKRGLSKEDIQREIMLRTKLLLEMYKNNIFEFKEVQSIIHEYFKDPKKILARFKVS